jgi:hypothetical protein
MLLNRQSNMPTPVRVKADRGARRGGHPDPPMREMLEFAIFDCRINKNVRKQVLPSQGPAGGSSYCRRQDLKGICFFNSEQ